MQCANHLKQIGQALHQYADLHPCRLPGEESGPRFPSGSSDDARLSWYVSILPYLDQQPLHDRFDLEAAFSSERNLAASQFEIYTLRCPDLDREFPRADRWLTPYVAIAGVAGSDVPGVFAAGRRTALSEITDGSSQTLLVLESAHENGPWAQGGFATVRLIDPANTPALGTDRPFGGTHFSSNTLFAHGTSIGCQGLLADGSVRYFSDDTDARVLAALATISGERRVNKCWSPGFSRRHSE